MAFVPTVGAVRVDVLQDLDDQHCENTLWYLAASLEWTVPEMEALADAINNIYISTMKTYHPANWVYRGCVVTDQSSEVAPAVNRPTLPTPGTDGGDPLPNNVAWVVKFLTNGRGRTSRGRNFVLGIATDKVVANTVDASWAAAVVTTYGQLLTPSVDVDANLSVVSHRINGADRTAGLAQPVTGIDFTDLTVDSQRRRLPGRGN